MHIVKAYSGQWGVYHPLFLAPAVGKGECLTLRLSCLTVGEEKYLLSLPTIDPRWSSPWPSQYTKQKCQLLGSGFTYDSVKSVTVYAV